MKSKLLILVMGIAGQSPFAGVAWQVLHFLEGFRRLGHDVYYLEDTGEWPYDPEKNSPTNDMTYTVQYLSRLMDWCRLSGHWAFCAPTDDRRIYGLSAGQVADLYQQADMLINLTGSTVLRDQHGQVPVRVYLETDPVLPQIEAAQGRQYTLDALKAHTHHFTYGENIGKPECSIPTGPIRYQVTRQPIVLDWWTSETTQSGPSQNEAAHPAFTTIANWRQTGKDIEWQGELYTWSKHHEFMKFLSLPKKIAQPFELALSMKNKWTDDGNCVGPSDEEDRQALQQLTTSGWSVADALSLSKDIEVYRGYIRGSRGEFTVAKDQNVRLRSGWFSDRSACYLAASRPVITQDTGFGDVIPTGEGLFPFQTLEEIVSAVEAINAEYERHCKAARTIAEEYFRAETVISKMLLDIG